MATSFRPLLVALLASSMVVPVSLAYAAPEQGQPVLLTAAPESLDPAAMETPMIDVDAEMTAGSEQDAEQSLVDALRFAYENNPTIRAARAELLAVQERLPQAQAGWKPTAAAEASITKTSIDSSPSSSADGSTAKQVGLSVSQPLFRGGRTVSGVDSAKNVIMAQRALLNQVEAGVLLNVATAYMNVLRDQSLFDLAQNNEEVIRKQRDATKARFDVGDVTRTDVSQAESRLADSVSGRISAFGNLRSSLSYYQQVVGMRAGRISFPKMVLPIPGSLDESVAMADNYNPAVLASKFFHDSAQKDIETAYGELLPTVSLVGSVGHTVDPSPGTFNHQTSSAIGVSASIPLYQGGAVRSRVRQARSTSLQKLIQVEDAQSQARDDVVSNWETLQAAIAEIDSRKVQVQASAVARDGVHKEAELGTRTILDALNADQELLNAQSALVTARRNEVVARFSLASALGLLTPEGLGFPEQSRDYNDHIREITGKVLGTTTEFSGVQGHVSAKKQ